MPNLEEWMIEKDKSIAELAELFRLSTKSIRAYLYKGAMPGRDAMHKIYNATGKEVDADAFYGLIKKGFDEEYRLSIEYTKEDVDIDLSKFYEISIPQEPEAMAEFISKLPKITVNLARKQCVFVRNPLSVSRKISIQGIPLMPEQLPETIQASIKEEKDGMVIHPARNEYEWIRYNFGYARMNVQKFNEHMKDFEAGKFKKLPKLQNHQKPSEFMKAKLSH